MSRARQRRGPHDALVRRRLAETIILLESAAGAMIHLKFLGHIRTSMGSEEIDVARDGITVEDLFAFLLSSKPAQLDHGFTKYNTLLVINDEEAFSAAAQKDRRIGEGDSVLLVPFSHGG